MVRSRRRAVAMPTPAIDLEAIRADHLAEVARLEAAHTGEVGALRNAIAEHGAELVLLVEVHADAFARLEKAHAGELDALRRELATANAWANRSWWRWLFGLPAA